MTATGQLRDALDIQENQATADAHGHQQANWVLKVEVWGQINTLAGEELFDARKAHPTATHKITIRYEPGLSSAMRVAAYGQTYEILSIIDPDSRRDVLEITARQIGGTTLPD